MRRGKFGICWIHHQNAKDFQRVLTADVFDELGEPYGSIGGSSLDDAEATHANQEEDSPALDGTAIETLLRTKDLTLLGLLSLTHVERLKWRLGMQLPMPLLCRRLFEALDTERVGLLPVESLEYIINYLSREFPMGKATTDLVQVRLIGSLPAARIRPSVSSQSYRTSVKAAELFAISKEIDCGANGSYSTGNV